MPVLAPQVIAQDGFVGHGRGCISRDHRDRPTRMRPATATGCVDGLDGNTGRVLALTDLRRRYGDTVALDGLSLEVPEGEVVGFVGRNGAGETTGHADRARRAGLRGRGARSSSSRVARLRGGVAEAVVQPVRSVLPELPGQRLDPVAAPLARHRQLPAGPARPPAPRARRGSRTGRLCGEASALSWLRARAAVRVGLGLGARPPGRPAPSILTWRPSAAQWNSSAARRFSSSSAALRLA